MFNPGDVVTIKSGAFTFVPVFENANNITGPTGLRLDKIEFNISTKAVVVAHDKRKHLCMPGTPVRIPSVNNKEYLIDSEFLVLGDFSSTL